MNIIPEFLGDLCMKGEQLLQSNTAWQKKKQNTLVLFIC